MKTSEIFEAYLNLVWNAFMYDVNALSVWWVWATILPALGYILFMLVKWTLLTMPIWIPIKLIRMLFCPKPSYYTSTGNHKEDLSNAKLAILDKIKGGSEEK